MNNVLLIGSGSGAAELGIEGPLTRNATDGSAVAWSPISAGVCASLSVALILLTLGSGIGLAAASPWSGRGASATTLIVITAVWLVVLFWLASGVGGYLTGRRRSRWPDLHTHEVFFRDRTKGFITWTVATRLGAGFVATVAVFTVSGAVEVTTGVTSSAQTEPAGEHNADLVDLLFRSDHVTTVNAEVKAQSSRVFVNAVSTGEMSAADTVYLTEVAADAAGMAPADAAKRVDLVMGQSDAARLKLTQAVNAARKGAATVSICTGLAMLIGAFCACAAAAIGGQQRDEYR